MDPLIFFLLLSVVAVAVQIIMTEFSAVLARLCIDIPIWVFLALHCLGHLPIMVAAIIAVVTAPEVYPAYFAIFRFASAIYKVNSGLIDDYLLPTAHNHHAATKIAIRKAVKTAITPTLTEDCLKEGLSFLEVSALVACFAVLHYALDLSIIASITVAYPIVTLCFCFLALCFCLLGIVSAFLCQKIRNFCENNIPVAERSDIESTTPVQVVELSVWDLIRRRFSAYQKPLNTQASEYASLLAHTA